MSLNKSTSKQAVRENIATEIAAGKPVKQAVAIALDVRKRAAVGQKAPAAPAKGKR